jgi:hypothetical protein
MAAKEGAMSEDLASAIVAHLDAVLPMAYRSLAIPNCAHLPPIPGLRAGAPRLAIIGAGRVYFIEALAEGCALSEDQEAWLCWCAAHGTLYCVARSLDDLRVALEHWRIPLRQGA